MASFFVYRVASVHSATKKLRWSYFDCLANIKIQKLSASWTTFRTNESAKHQRKCDVPLLAYEIKIETVRRILGTYFWHSAYKKSFFVAANGAKNQEKCF